MVLTKGIFIIAAKRTPFGTYGGKFTNTTATDLAETAAKAALVAGKVNPEVIDHTIFGHVLTASASDGLMLSRHVALRVGVPQVKPSYAINRLCGSGFQSIVNGCQSILTGESKIVLTGGADNMSQAPYVVRNVRFGAPLGSNIAFEDTLWVSMFDSHCKLSMGLTAEKLGAQFKLTREEVDEFALQSQIRWKKAQDSGLFEQELAPVTIMIKKKETVVSVDEHPRPQTTIEGLQKLPSVFQKNGLITAGSASGICDGAGAVIIANEEALKDYSLTPLARLVGYSVVGVDPSIMGIGPSPAIKQLLKESNKTLEEIDLVEINEAFGCQTVACAKDLNVDMNKLNVNGGAIAVGHPLGASGTRITAHLVHELKRRNKKFGIGSACIGGGQGIALLLENI